MPDGPACCGPPPSSTPVRCPPPPTLTPTRRRIAFLGSGLLLANYVGAIALALRFPLVFSRLAMGGGHALLALVLLYKTVKLDAAKYSQQAIKDYYAAIWWGTGGVCVGVLRWGGGGGVGVEPGHTCMPYVGAPTVAGSTAAGLQRPLGAVPRPALPLEALTESLGGQAALMPAGRPVRFLGQPSAAGAACPQVTLPARLPLCAIFFGPPCRLNFYCEYLLLPFLGA